MPRFQVDHLQKQKGSRLPPTKLSKVWLSLGSLLSRNLKRIIALCLAEKNYLLAIEQYGKAIDSNPLSAVYHANRAFAHIRMETYGSAVEDAAQAIALDPKYVKV